MSMCSHLNGAESDGLGSRFGTLFTTKHSGSLGEELGGFGKDMGGICAQTSHVKKADNS